MSDDPRITTIVLTGGPCAGKTTALAILQERLAERGVHVVVVPEAARDFQQHGLRPDELGRADFQLHLMRYVLDREQLFAAAASKLAAQRIVLLCDRGVMDAQAYVEPGEFAELLSAYGTNVADMRDGRYDAVIHLHTAALGAEDVYAVDAVRGETPEQARALDERTLQAWVGHPHVSIIDNSTDFATKMRRVLQQVCHILGMPVPVEHERKFLVRPPVGTLSVPHQAVRVAQRYLLSPAPNTERRVRSWTQGDASTYFFTEKRGRTARERRERERRITEREFREHLLYADPAFGPITKTRTCFVWCHQYMELDDLTSLQQDLFLLEVETTDRQQDVVLPDFLDVVEDVTDNPEYTNHELARIR